MFDSGAAGRIGPLLYLHGHAPGRLRLAALVVRPDGETPGPLTTPDGEAEPERLTEIAGCTAWRYRFELPATAGTWYELDGIRYPVHADVEGDLRIAYVSCDGMEEGDEKRPPEERNLMWHRLAERHGAAPFTLMLHGGDQIYADEVVLVHPASAKWPHHVPAQLAPAEADGLLAALRTAFFRRYIFEFTQPDAAWLAARVPSLAMWDDHDICNGWGSLAPRKLESAVGQALFQAGREFFLLFQLCATPDDLPDMVLDRTGTNLTWAVTLPGLHVIAPDLRSERRPRQVMGAAGWKAMNQALASVEDGKVLVLSSVPALGPRLSIIERIMQVTPWLEKYESDLRDQWQSRRHRAEWRSFLAALIEVDERPGVDLTVLSGEIHLATRATMKTRRGEMHQLIASGIAHPPPPGAYAVVMGWLASLGEAPLPDHPISLHPLPGQPRIYAAERNYLVIERSGGRWHASWDLEHSGPTAPLALDGSAPPEAAATADPAAAPQTRPAAAHEPALIPQDR